MDRFCYCEFCLKIVATRNDTADTYKAEGIEIGEEKRAMEIARTMLQEGMEIVFIAKLTGLSHEQIKALC